MLKNLFWKLAYGGTPGLRPYEADCLDHAKGAIAPEGQAVLERQIGALNLVQRFSKDKMVTLHFPREAAELPLFSNRSEECRAIRLRLKPSYSSETVTADVVFHGGRLSSLEYSKPPTSSLAEGFSVKRVQLLEDLHSADPARESLGELGPLLQRLGQKCQLKDVMKPASAGRQSALLERLGAVPEDYVVLLRETDGFTADDWWFSGTKARRLPTQDGIWLLAETSESALCLREGAKEPEVLLYDQIDDACTSMGRSFMDAFRSVLAEQGAS